MPALAARGVELSWSDAGQGPAVLLVHETAVTRAAWEPVAEALSSSGVRVVSFDRRGWGASTAPADYLRTTIEEQSEDAAALLASLAAGPAVLAGAGIGAVIALDLLLRRSELVAAAVLVEPPLLALVPEATERLSADREALEVAAGKGRDALVELYLSGGLGTLAAGAERLPPELTAAGRERPASLVAELGTVASWGVPLPRLGEAQRPSRVVTSPSTPPILRDASEALVARLAGAKAAVVGQGRSGPPHVADPGAVASQVAELAGGG